MDSDEVAGYAIIKETEKSLEKLNQLWEWYRTAPDFVDKLLNIKNLCWWNKNYPVYFAVCERVARELPYHSMTMQFRKDTITGYLHLDELRTAEDALRLFVADYADDERMAESLNEIARLYNEKGYYQEGEALYQYVLGRTSQDESPVMTLAGLIVSQIGRNEAFADIEAQMDELIVRYADDPNGLAEAILMVGEAYYQEGQRAMRNWDAEQTADSYRKAIEILRRNIDAAEGRYFSEACYLAGFLWHHLEEYEEALAYFHTVLEETPDFDQAWFVHHLVASCWDKLCRKGTLTFEEAKPFVLEACARLEAINPNSPAKTAAEQLVEKYSKN